MASKKGFAAGRAGGRDNELAVGFRDNVGMIFDDAAVVEQWEKADMGSWRVRRTPEGAGSGMKGEAVTSSNSGSGEGGSDVIRSRCVLHTAWNPPCNHPRSPVNPSFLNFLSKPLMFEASGMAAASAS
jgi:hypothetical protein